MRVKSGFFNSKNQDRVYDASDFGKIFDGIINDGVYGTIGDKFMVSPAGGLSVNVGTGRAWFNHVWVLNDSTMTLTLLGNATTLPRIDAVIFEVNTTEQVRATEITTIQGTPAASPQRPAVVSEGGVYRYPIAYIRMDANDPIIDASDITYVVGTNACPIITAPLQVSSFEQWLTQWTSEFYTWFSHLHNELDENQAAHLQNQIDELSEKMPTSEEWITKILYASDWTVRTSYQGVPQSYRYDILDVVVDGGNQYDILDVLPSTDNSYDTNESEWRKLYLMPFQSSGTSLITMNGIKPAGDIKVKILRKRRTNTNG